MRWGLLAGLAACLALPACQDVGGPYYGGGPGPYDGGPVAYGAPVYGGGGGAVVVQERGPGYGGYGYGRPYEGPGYGRGYDRGYDRRGDRDRFERERQQRRVEPERRPDHDFRREARPEPRREDPGQRALRAVQDRDTRAQQEMYRSQGIR